MQRIIRKVIDQDKPDYWNEHYSGTPYQDNQRGDRDLFKQFLDEVIDYSKPLHILEIGCGIGDYADYIASKLHPAGLVMATDYSHTAIKQCQKRFPDSKAHYEVIDAREIPLEQWDIIIAFEIIEHFKDYRPVLYRIMKALAVDGKFVFSLPHKDGSNGDLPGHLTFWDFNLICERMYRYWPIIQFHRIRPLVYTFNIFGVARRVKK